MKSIKVFFVTVLVLVFSFGPITSSYASEIKTLDKSVDPYQEVMDKLTDEFGVSFYVSPEKKEYFYDSVKDMNAKEFEEMLRSQYQEFMDNSNTNIDTTTNIQQASSIVPFSMREQITQTTSLSYSSSMFLKSTVFSATGSQGTFKYESINSYGTDWPPDYTGYHWQVDSKSYSLSSDAKSCKVTLRGHPENAKGVSLAFSLTATNTFYAN